MNHCFWVFKLVKRQCSNLQTRILKFKYKAQITRKSLFFLFFLLQHSHSFCISFRFSFCFLVFHASVLKRIIINGESESIDTGLLERHNLLSWYLDIMTWCATVSLSWWNKPLRKSRIQTQSADTVRTDRCIHSFHPVRKKKMDLHWCNEEEKNK